MMVDQEWESVPGGRTGRPAAFIDRDGTLIEERNYLADPDGVALIPGTIGALKELHRAGFAIIVVTNQSGIARGLIEPAEYRAVERRVAELLAAKGVELDGVYHCPHHPEFTGPCDCRKPGLALYREAARDHGLDLTSSIYIGDREGDALPARSLGGTGYLVRTGYGAALDDEVAAGFQVVRDLAEAVERHLGALPKVPAGQVPDREVDQ